MSRCTDCGRHIAGTRDDQVHAMSAGTFCTACFRKRLNAPVAPKVRSTGRGDAARARWAAMTPEQKAERVAKLQAGRRTA